MLRRALKHGDRVALVSSGGEKWSYADLLSRSGAVARGLRAAGVADASSTVAFLTPEEPCYVAAQWGIWRAGGVAVPLCTKHPAEELAYVVGDSGARTVVGHRDFEPRLRPIVEEAGARYVAYEDIVAAAGTSRKSAGFVAAQEDGVDLDLAPDRPAHVLYTSGTTGRPKGVLHSHGALDAQVTDLTKSWGWSPSDRILHFLPLHHAHGIVNKLCCALHAGATVEFTGGFDAQRLWQRLIAHEEDGMDEAEMVSVLMAVPTVYAKLIEEFDHRLEGREQALARRSAAALRLMVSGSAALPVSVLKRWREITTHTLLERYGMTEFGMGLSNPLKPMGQRRVGYVGQPLPSCEARVVRSAEEDADADVDATSSSTSSSSSSSSSSAGEEIVCGAGESGELRIRGANLFSEYLNKPEATAAEFDAEGWFKTGDVAQWDDFPEGPCFKILGRASVDIIKSGGYKISALDVERQMLEHPDVAEAAVVGVEDEVYGQRVGAFVRTRPSAQGARPLDGAALHAWLKERLAPYAVPSLDITRFVDDIPKNQMGKVNKKTLAPVLLLPFNEEEEEEEEVAVA